MYVFLIPSPLDEWSSVTITGQAPPPCFNFTLTPVEGNKAAMFGGLNGSGTESDDLYIAELTRHSVVSQLVHRNYYDVLKYTAYVNALLISISKHSKIISTVMQYFCIQI